MQSLPSPIPRSAKPAAELPAERPQRLNTLLSQLQPTPGTWVLLLALLIGVGAGVGVLLFRALIQIVHHLMFGEVSSYFSAWGHWTLALIPLLGGMAIGLLRWWIKDFGPGLTTLIEVVQGSREVLLLNPVTKMVTASISLGSGAALGPEGPSVEIGAYFSLLLGQVLRVSQERRRLLLSAGAAAGLAAGFNAPIAGVFFALEVILGSTFAASTASVVLLAAVVAAWIVQIGLGSQPAFALPAYEVRSLLELPLYLGLGLLASLVSLLYVQALGFSQRAFQGKVARLSWLAQIPLPLHPVLGGLCLGLVALKLPQILGVGYETVEALLQDVQFPLSLVILLLVVKLIMTALSFGSGFVGGVFAPALFLGASLGSVYSKLLGLVPLLHDSIASPPAYAMVGMAAVLAGSVRAPLTAILLLFELTHDYRIVLPLMAAVGLSIWLVEYLHPQVVIDNSPPPEMPEPEVPLTATLTVAEAMQSETLKLTGSLSLLEASQTLLGQRMHSALVIDGTGLLGIVTLQDMNRALLHAKSEPEVRALLHQPIQTICTTKLVSAYPDELLSEASRRMTTRGLQQLPVLSRDQPPQVIGLLTPEGITLADGIARTREMLHRHLEQPEVPEPAVAQIPPPQISILEAVKQSNELLSG
ncbi:MAG: chloride channel protein [Pegethrix bostrychoides GSE-TBD4-15B]|jgi:H+/Cl- antiporter ClcA/CBS domain-containing protein|uniref:Chloride channel protein n=1 Tax=Pegethrix bostrychoides GSE-TBD4-15B TaxID=2839662 RepID=A0A951PEP8_9CYAN|nr:chloride channel protein [Pegethrix bostrychoides GSE-TBD4-15B]